MATSKESTLNLIFSKPPTLTSIWLKYLRRGLTWRRHKLVRDGLLFKTKRTSPKLSSTTFQASFIEIEGHSTLKNSMLCSLNKSIGLSGNKSLEPRVSSGWPTTLDMSSWCTKQVAESSTRLKSLGMSRCLRINGWKIRRSSKNLRNSCRNIGRNLTETKGMKLCSLVRTWIKNKSEKFWIAVWSLKVSSKNMNSLIGKLKIPLDTYGTTP